MATRTDRPTRQSAPGRTRLDRAQVIDTSLDLVDREGLDALTIRRLAQELRVTPMALYWHVADKDALLAGVAERLWSDVVAALAVADPLDGWDGLRSVVATLVDVLRQHPAAATLAPLQVITCDAGLEVTERTLELLAGLGFDDEHGAQMAHLLLFQAVALVGAQPGADAADAPDPEDAQRRKRIALASLPPDRYPRTVAAAEHLTGCADAGVYFGRGIDLVMAGIRQQAPDRHLC